MSESESESELPSEAGNPNPGPFLFAWVGADETTFNESHHRDDEQVLSLAITHNEGDFASLEITIINPRVGLLAPGRDVWAWLSFDKNWKATPPDQVSESETPSEVVPDIVPLFFGRLLAVPDDLHAEQVTLSFLARPLNFAEQKTALAETLKVRPYWDGIWFSPETRDDPDNVLEARPELWHIDRVTHAVTTSHILNGEDGLIELGEADTFYDSMSITYGEAPLRRVQVNASVSWDQKAKGKIQISNRFGHSIRTFTGDGLVANWPKTGTQIGEGWFVAFASAKRVDGYGISAWHYNHSWGLTEGRHNLTIPSWAVQTTNLGQTFPPHTFSIPLQRVSAGMVLGYDVSRARSEQLSFTLSADVQSVLTEAGDEESLLLSFSSSEIATPVDPVESASATESESEQALALPIGDVRNRIYFASDRGEQSIEYLISLARARLLARARTVSIEFEIPFLTGIDLELSCRKSVLLTDYRLPGGSAAGKITSYTLSSDGESGALTCAIVIGASVGLGNTVTAVDGAPTYVETGYVEPGYQRYEGAFVMPIAGEVTYGSVNGQEPTDDGLDFTRLTAARAIISLNRFGTPAEQIAAMGEFAEEPNEVFERLNAVQTRYRLELVPFQDGPFETVYALQTSQLMVPKTIDLEAAP